MAVFHYLINHCVEMLMGTWNHLPWDSDDAADWFAGLMDKTNFAKAVERGLKLDPEEHPNEVRAAASMLIALGRVYVWPIDRLDSDLKSAIAALKKVRKSWACEENKELGRMLDIEIEILRGRLKRPPTPPKGKATIDLWRSWM